MNTYYRLTPIEEEKPPTGELMHILIEGKYKRIAFLSDKDGKYYEGALSKRPFIGVTHWLKPVNPVEALIEKYDIHLGNLHELLCDFDEDYNKEKVADIKNEIKITGQFINDLKNI